MHEIAEARFRTALRVRHRRRLPFLPLRIPLLTRIVLGSALLATLVGSLFVVLVVAVSSLRATTSDATRSKDMTEATLVLERNAIELETSLRGYVITGGRRFLQPWREARALLPRSIASVERLAADNVKRVVHGNADAQSPWEIAAFLELKTVWHPVGQ